MSTAGWDIATIPVITVICFLCGEIVKLTPLNEKWIPVTCGIIGGCLGVVAMYVMPNFVAQDILTAIAVGIVSGLGATGAHQVYKQLTKNSQEPDVDIGEEE